MVEDVGVALGGDFQKPHILLRIGDAAGLQIGGDLAAAHPQVFLGDHDKNALDMLGHEPCGDRAPANQDKPYIRPLLQRNDLPAQFLAFQPVQVVDHHYPALLSARFQPGQRPILPGQFLTGEVSVSAARQILAYQFRLAIAGGPVKVNCL